MKEADERKFGSLRTERSVKRVGQLFTTCLTFDA